MNGVNKSIPGFKRGADVQPPKTKKYFRKTASGAGMTKAGVARYRRENPGSKLKTTSATGTTLFEADVPAGDITSLNIPEDGILFPQGLYVSTFTVAKATLLTDKYSGPNLIGQNG